MLNGWYDVVEVRFDQAGGQSPKSYAYLAPREWRVQLDDIVHHTGMSIGSVARVTARNSGNARKGQSLRVLDEYTPKRFVTPLTKKVTVNVPPGYRVALIRGTDDLDADVHTDGLDDDFF